MTAEMRRPRVLMIIAKFHPVIGGTENQALLLCESLIKKGLDVEVLTRKVHGLPDYAYVRGVPVNRAIKVIDWGKLFGVTYFLSCLYFLFVHRRKFDIVHCHILHGFHSMAAVFMKILFGKKVIIKIANTDLDSDFLQLTKMRCGAWFLRFLQRADCLVALCQRSVQEALQNGFAEACTQRIPNGVDTMRFLPTGPYPGLRDRIVCVSRLTRIKGIDVLLDAFGQLRREGFRLRLDIYGDGPEKERLLMAADDFGLTGTVVFHGQIGTVEAVFENALVLVQPSLAEGMSNVILEAMAAGVAVVATRTGAAEDIIQDGVSGLLVDPGSARQIHDAVRKLLSNEILTESIGRRARAAVESSCSIETVAGRYVELYQSLLNPTAACGDRGRIV